jgi:carbamate kinase
MRVVIALGGNALLRRDEPPNVAAQRSNAAIAVAAIAEVAARDEVVVTHGNGPQVGLLALQSESYPDADPTPLDVLGAESEGMIGYLLDQELTNALGGRPVATLLTQTVVDVGDPAFAVPTKPIGPVYTERRARRLAMARGWSVAADGSGFRRVVASPEPLEILEARTIELLVDAGVVVICAGGGGIPVVCEGDRIRGVEAVVDKDLAANVLAQRLRADALLMLTDVTAVQLDWGTPSARPLRSATPTELRRHTFAAGSMAPKVEAACRFVEATGGVAGIGALRDAAAILRGDAGTLIASALRHHTASSSVHAEPEGTR